MGVVWRCEAASFASSPPPTALGAFACIIQSAVPAAALRQELSQAGGMHRRWMGFQRYFSAQVQQSSSLLAAHRSERLVWDREREQKKRQLDESLSTRQRRAKQLAEEKRRMAAQLAAMGLEVAADLEEDDTAGANAVELRRLRVTKQFDSEARLQHAYAVCWHALVGVHGVQVQSGENRLSLSFQGLDIFELLPEPEDGDGASHPGD